MYDIRKVCETNGFSYEETGNKINLSFTAVPNTRFKISVPKDHFVQSIYMTALYFDPEAIHADPFSKRTAETAVKKLAMDLLSLEMMEEKPAETEKVSDKPAERKCPDLKICENSGWKVSTHKDGTIISISPKENVRYGVRIYNQDDILTDVKCAADSFDEKTFVVSNISKAVTADDITALVDSAKIIKKSLCGLVSALEEERTLQ